ncbi:YopX family protein [Paenimyroides ceti]
MNREIEFRGLRTDGKGWVYGYYHEEELLYGSHSHIMYSDVDNENDEQTKQYSVHVFRESVGQFTGLYDKNGVKIFEGDIVDVTGKPYASIDPILVVWGTKSHGWSIKFNCGKHYEHNPLLKYYSLPSKKNIEIIGNIHEKK